MNNKFINLWESAIQRFTRGGFLVGDYINFIDDYKSHDSYSELPQELQDQLEDLIAGGLHIRVLNIKDTQPGRFPGNIDTQNGNSVVLDIAADHGGGGFGHCAFAAVGRPFGAWAAVGDADHPLFLHWLH